MIANPPKQIGVKYYIILYYIILQQRVYHPGFPMALGCYQ